MADSNTRDGQGNLITSTTVSSHQALDVNLVAGGGSGSNAAAGPTGSAVPGSADYIGFNSGGNLVGVSAGNPLPVTGTINASNPSVGTTGTTAPTSATEVGFISGANLVGVSAANALPVTVENASLAVTGTFFQATQPVSGTVAVTQSTSPWVVGQATGSNLHVVVDTAPSTAVTNAGTFAVQATLPAGQAVELLDSGGTNKASISAAGAVKVDGSAVTQPVSLTSTAITGTVGVTQSTSPWVTEPTTGGVYSHNLNQDGSGNIGVNIQNTPAVTLASTTITNFPATQIVQDTAAEASLTTLVSTTIFQNQMIELLTQILAQAKYNNILLASHTNGSIDDLDQITVTMLQ